MASYIHDDTTCNDDMTVDDQIFLSKKFYIICHVIIYILYFQNKFSYIIPYCQYVMSSIVYQFSSYHVIFVR